MSLYVFSLILIFSVFNLVNFYRYLTIDETDRMLEKGHFEELGQLLNRINLSEEKRKKRQTFVFSATLTIVHDPPSYLKGKYVLLPFRSGV